MISIPERYETHFFTDIADLRPSADTISPLLEAFRDVNLLPTTYTEIGLFPRPEVRLRLMSPNNEWVIDFDITRISISKNKVKAGGANLGAIEEFTRNSTDFLGRILTRFPKKSHRLGLVTRGFMSEMSGEQLLRIYRCLFLPIRFYQDNVPISWNFRTHTRIPENLGDNQEIINVITRVNRIKGTFIEEGSSVPFDRIRLDFDINTSQDNKEARFDLTHLNSFNSITLRIRNLLLSQLKEQFNG